MKRRWLHSEGRSPVKLPLGASSLTKSYQTAIRLFVPTADYRVYGERRGSWCLPVAYLSEMPDRMRANRRGGRVLERTAAFNELIRRRNDRYVGGLRPNVSVPIWKLQRTQLLIRLGRKPNDIRRVFARCVRCDKDLLDGKAHRAEPLSEIIVRISGPYG